MPIDRLAEIAPACRISRARVVDAGRVITAGGITSGNAAHELYREDREEER